MITQRQRQRQQVLTTIILVGMLLVLILTYNRKPLALNGTTETAISTITGTYYDNNNKSNILQLASGELPGYTGWARPESTLAGKFGIVDESSSVVSAGTTWHVTLQCQDSTACPSDNTSQSWFYVRAYGPAIVTGAVQQQHSARKMHQYRIDIPLLDPGVYMLEVVLTFSAVPSIDSFPLQDKKAVPSYEGYLISGFPRQVQVVGETVDNDAAAKYCSRNDLLVTQLDTALWQGRWKVVDSNRWESHTPVLPANNIRLEAYQQSYNSLGVKLSYERPDCRILAAPTARNNWLETCLATANNNNNASLFHFILIGDSTMRLQKDTLEAWWQSPIQQGRVKVTFVELYGGTLRCERLSGPRVSDLIKTTLAMSSSTNDNEERVVLFNTGLHDIHRLCGTEWQADRQQYLSPHELQLPCVELYRTTVLPTLMDAVLQIPAIVHLFQTTTAAWPKYGNYGVVWNPARGQGLPLDAGFVDQFNRIAIEFLTTQAKYRAKIKIVDGYWITLARPDNREIDKESNLSKKLSHPGVEVVHAMVRLWSHVMLQTMCASIFDD